MSGGTLRRIYIAEESLRGLGDLPLAEGVIPALLRLMSRGYRLVCLNQEGDPTGRDGGEISRLAPDRLHALLASQGVVFERIVTRQESQPGPRASLGDWTLFAREEIWAGTLDRARSAVLGVGERDAEVATLLGLRYLVVSPGPERDSPEIRSQSWCSLAEALMTVPRRGEVERRTTETAIQVKVDLSRDGSQSLIATGIGFFDHMLEQLARHGGFGLEVRVEGDLAVDDHHTVEDTGLALGEALRRALGDRFGIARYGFTLPMDEALATCALDLSGRPWLEFHGSFDDERVGGLATAMVPHFFRSFCQTLGATMHLTVTGHNAHHQIEGLFKAVAKSLRMAIQETGEAAIPSTKGLL